MNRILLFLISLLGFSTAACDKSDSPGHGHTNEYAAPYATFKMKGKVVDENQQPINHIEMTVVYGDYKIFTDSVGQYQAEVHAFPWDSLTVIATDIDGEANGGEFEPAMKRVGVNPEELQGGSGWNQGSVTKEVNFELKRKE